MENIKIPIAANGLTTLATAGKYCDRNVDIEVNVPTGGGGDIETIQLTGEARGLQGIFVANVFDMLKEYIKADNITEVYEMFYSFNGDEIPCDIHLNVTSYISFGSMFQNCYNLKHLPKIVGNVVQPSNIKSIFAGCYHLQEIPEDYFDNWNFTRMHSVNSASASGVFSSCYSLRKIPQKFLTEGYSGIQNSGTYSPYANGFSSCHALDEIVGVELPKSVCTSNMFSGAFSATSRLKRMVFAMNEDGTPQTRKWKSQAISLSANVGYASQQKYITDYSGISASKLVSDDATYQALKDDPDWFTLDMNYSRYNHDSAVETINSLPDTSEYLATAGGTNTISFRGDAGALTDGGAINTLTEAEIAVATAKGWSVTFV